jgi:hypothetical protein
MAGANRFRYRNVILTILAGAVMMRIGTGKRSIPFFWIWKIAVDEKNSGNR